MEAFFKGGGDLKQDTDLQNNGKKCRNMEGTPRIICKKKSNYASFVAIITEACQVSTE